MPNEEPRRDEIKDFWKTLKIRFYELSDPVINIVNISLFFVSVAALISLILEYGFYISEQTAHIIERVNILIVLYYVLQYFVKLLFNIKKWNYIKTHWFETALVILIIAETTFVLHQLGFSQFQKYLTDLNVKALTRLTIVGAQVVIILTIISGAVRLNRKIAYLRFHPAQTFMLSFFVVIVLGTFLLMLPRSVAPGHTLSWLDALFTATSATCVTGLIVVDTGSHFSLLGQLIILTLIQIGGLGIMTISSFFALFFGRGMAIKERIMLQEMLNVERLDAITRLLKGVILITFLMESLGALLLFFSWNLPQWDFSQRLYHSIFHSISAFCNAGFSLNSDSLMSFNTNYSVVLTIAMLIIVGGLGFVVMIDLTRGKIFEYPTRRRVRKFSVHTRLVLIVTSVLLIAGTILFLIIEPFSGNWLFKTVNAFFCSVTARTAGFNTVDIGQLTTSSALLLMLLMFIGASPGSTGGGIKTTTLGILIASFISIIRGKNRIELFKRSISFTILNRALVVFAFAISFIMFSTFLLSLTEKASFINLLFEEISAFGTVGLSRGITAGLSSWGKIVIIVSMFVGRVGVLTLAFAITTPREHLRVEYPEERNVMVG
ncbi:MAG: Trk family potassium uptake protein [Caldisericaceae bacterium]|nr:Trk family potassium uptake protein [Caldisericaceae bacterium]